jgi:hypothetical protein
MAITFVGATEANVDGQSLTISVVAGLQDNDVMWLIVTQSDGEDGSWNSLTGWVEQVVDAIVGGGPPSAPETSVFRRVVTDAGSEPASYAPSVDTGADVGLVGKMVAFRGVDIVTPVDATATTATGSGDANPNPPSITTVTDGAFVLAVGFKDDDNGVYGSVPTNYTDPDGLGTVVNAGGGNGCSLGCAYREIVSFGAEDPGTFDFTDSDEWGAISLAIRPITAEVEQEGHHFRLDDGSESAATFLGAQDSNITRAKEVNTRLRVLVDAAGDPATAQLTLQFRRVGDADTEWEDV